MPKGREICEYALKVRSTNRAPGPAGSTILSMNLAGEASNGSVIATATMDASLDRPIDFRTLTIQDDGTIASGSGIGFCLATGEGRWATKIFMFADNTPVALQEGVFDQETSTLTAKEFEWIAETTPFTQVFAGRIPAWLKSKAA